MSSLISINSKFMSIEPKDLVKYINNSKYTKGVEAYIDFRNKEEIEYLDKLVIELKKNNLILQIHGEVYLDLDKQFEYIKLLDKYSLYLGYPIVFTLHSIYNKDKEESIEETYNYISKLINNNLIICMENLNNREGRIRLHTDDIESTILGNDNIYFTYDIGHELIDTNRIIGVNDNMLEKIRNVHIHSISNGNDHIPIYKDDIYLDEIVNYLKFLNKNYKYNMVYEYGIDYCRGNSLDEKIVDYLESMDYITSLVED